MLGQLINVVLAAAAVGLLILIHEVGHFLAAKAMRVRVEIFSIGFLSKLVGFRRGQTEYRLSLVPLGGYVKLAGMTPSEATGAPDEFVAKRPGQRAFILVAGVAMNAVLGLVGFIVAFTIGVPFPVAEVGYLRPGWPAWKAGLRQGDVIERINNISSPDFQDVQREVALQGLDTASLTVRRGEQRLQFELDLRYDPKAGIKRIGFGPPILPIVTGLFRVDGERGRCPAREAGIRIGDRIVAVEGRPISCAREFAEELKHRLNEDVELTVERGREVLTLTARTEPLAEHWIGISGVSATIQSLQRDGRAQRMGLQPGDRIASVNGVPVQSIVQVEDILRDAYGVVVLAVERGGTSAEVRGEIEDERALEDLIRSMDCTSSNTLAWVAPGSPAAQAGMRPGDVIVQVGGRTVETWDEILAAGRAAGDQPRLMRWLRDGTAHSGTVAPVKDYERAVGSIGCVFNRAKYRMRRLGVLSAIRVGSYKTYGAVVDIVLSLKGFVRREVSTRNVGGVVLIAYSSYLAAKEGPGKLLYLTAMLSIALAFLNIWPIPVLDGGHLLFVAIEKLRGKPVGEKVMTVSQLVGLGLLIMLIAYAVRNDLLRLLDIG